MWRALALVLVACGAAAPPVARPVTDADLAKRFARLADPRELARLAPADESLVVDTGYPEAQHSCPRDADRAELLAELAHEADGGHTAVVCHAGATPYCYTESGVIDPPDSNWERRWYLFDEPAPGALRLRAIVVSPEYDREVNADLADALSRVHPKACTP